MRITSIAVLTSLFIAGSSFAEEARPKAKPPAEPPPRPSRVEERPQPCRSIDPEATLRLDFQGAPLTAFVGEVARLTCKQFLIDDAVVATRVNVISGGELRGRELWPTFLHALAVHGLVAFERGSTWAIGHATDGARLPIPTLGPDEPLPEEERMVTKLFYVSDTHDINALTNMLNIFKSGKGQIHPWQPGNLVVATDYTSSLRRVLKILAAMQAAPARPAPKPQQSR